MRIFVNDKPLDLISYEELDGRKTFESIYHQPDELLNSVEWQDDVLFHEPSHDLVIKLLYVLRTRKLKNLDSITLVTKDKASLKKFVKSRFMIIKAAGGVVTNKKKKVLLIFRLGKWDFPKGKFDKGETPEQCALREVEEECAVKVKVTRHLYNTWHTYTQNRKSILKKTYWYEMECLDDKNMTPQKEEGIDDIRWFYEPDAKIALVNSYPSMRYLFKQFIKNHPKPQIL
ncbi:8-oxo-dGTP pyrophosphatase MutT (NUDIX family) [Algoriphagus iocasae]|jgi:8-oxo-(d)GTP phosphatase|uniref:8-oxo-dGTP pyrophosphatase MutT (NUDIX family) n=1 Tax=Algoriphagus iocasae TaxID=1836499 RepID=A0A841MJ18_9BACT|nr:NUDIX hydrolase [Algoriphagus iocasae]MBB6325319.1 8-oxo-dGTP pyrophosphatase MutT (NUDIX family) [Algoriphagus iocasae]